MVEVMHFSWIKIGITIHYRLKNTMFWIFYIEIDKLITNSEDTQVNIITFSSVLLYFCLILFIFFLIGAFALLPFLCVFSHQFLEKAVI